MYRLEIVFENGTGKRLGRFGEYFRALRRTPADARLSLNGTSFFPGQTVSAQLENWSTATMLFGLFYWLEAFDGAGWVPASVGPLGPFLAIGLGAGPGEAASCWNFHIPSDVPAGLYRFVVNAEYTYMRFERRIPVTLTSEFEILPAG